MHIPRHTGVRHRFLYKYRSLWCKVDDKMAAVSLAISTDVFTVAAGWAPSSTPPGRQCRQVGGSNKKVPSTIFVRTEQITWTRIERDEVSIYFNIHNKRFGDESKVRSLGTVDGGGFGTVSVSARRPLFAQDGTGESVSVGESGGTVGVTNGHGRCDRRGRVLWWSLGRAL